MTTKAKYSQDTLDAYLSNNKKRLPPQKVAVQYSDSDSGDDDGNQDHVHSPGALKNFQDKFIQEISYKNNRRVNTVNQQLPWQEKSNFKNRGSELAVKHNDNHRPQKPRGNSRGEFDDSFLFSSQYKPFIDKVPMFLDESYQKPSTEKRPLFDQDDNIKVYQKKSGSANRPMRNPPPAMSTTAARKNHVQFNDENENEEEHAPSELYSRKAAHSAPVYRTNRNVNLGALALLKQKKRTLSAANGEDYSPTSPSATSPISFPTKKNFAQDDDDVKPSRKPSRREPEIEEDVKPRRKPQKKVKHSDDEDEDEESPPPKKKPSRRDDDTPPRAKSKTPPRKAPSRNKKVVEEEEEEEEPEPPKPRTRSAKTFRPQRDDDEEEEQAKKPTRVAKKPQIKHSPREEEEEEEVKPRAKKALQHSPVHEEKSVRGKKPAVKNSPREEEEEEEVKPRRKTSVKNSPREEEKPSRPVKKIPIKQRDEEEEEERPKPKKGAVKNSPRDERPVKPSPRLQNVDPQFLEELPDEQPDEPIDLVECPDCERKFAEDRIEKHMKMCKKVFGSKRKAFSVSEARMTEEMKEIASKTEKEKKNHKTEDSPVPIKKVAKWKKESEALRRALGMAVPNAQFGDGKTNEPPPPPEDDRKECTNCGRKFNEDVLVRHLKVCTQIKNGPTQLKKGSGAAGGAKTNLQTKQAPNANADTNWKLPNMGNRQQPQATMKQAPAKLPPQQAKPKPGAQTMVKKR